MLAGGDSVSNKKMQYSRPLLIVMGEEDGRSAAGVCAPTGYAASGGCGYGNSNSSGDCAAGGTAMGGNAYCMFDGTTAYYCNYGDSGGPPE